MLYRRYCSVNELMKYDLPEPLGPKQNRFLALILFCRIGRSDGSIATGMPCRSVNLTKKSEGSSVSRASLKKKQRAASEVVRNHSYFCNSTALPGKTER